jgi:hypothetical protein
MYYIVSPEWAERRPPPRGSPHNCRCGSITLTLEQARARGFQG